MLGIQINNFQANKLCIFYSPAMSPDLNPIEWLWSDLKRYVRKRFCSTEEEIVMVINEFQQQITPEYCQNFIDKLQTVIKNVIKKNGSWSNY